MRLDSCGLIILVRVDIGPNFRNSGQLSSRTRGKCGDRCHECSRVHFVRAGEQAQHHGSLVFLSFRPDVAPLPLIRIRCVRTNSLPIFYNRIFLRHLTDQKYLTLASSLKFLTIIASALHHPSPIQKKKIPTHTGCWLTGLFLEVLLHGKSLWVLNIK